MSKTQEEEKLAVECRLLAFVPVQSAAGSEGKNPFTLDSKEPDWTKFQDFLNSEVRYTSLKKSFPAKQLNCLKLPKKMQNGGIKLQADGGNGLSEIEFNILLFL